MVKRRFVVLFRRWFVTAVKVFGPILGFELFVFGREYFRCRPLSIEDLLLAGLTALLLIAGLCWLWAWGEWWWSKLRRIRGFGGELARCSRDYWKPAAVKTHK
jgi:hypothetical protein